MLRVAVTGATGRMGRAIVQALQASEDDTLVLAAAIHRPDSSLLGTDVGEVAGIGKLGVPIVSGIEEVEFDVLIDFSPIELSLIHI